MDIMVGTTTCFLCRERPAIENSHILPKLIVRAICEDLGVRGLRELSAPRLRVERTTVVPLLCTECEAQFQSYENDFARSCLRPYFMDDRIVIEHDARLLAFAVSVLWRVLIHTLNQTVPPEWMPCLARTARAWRAYLRGEALGLGEHKCYLFLDREFSEEQIKLSHYLNHVDLRFTIEQGATSVTNIIGVPYRNVVYAKLGPFIFVGTVQDVFHGQIDHLIASWREISSNVHASHAVDDGVQLPDEIVAMIDKSASRWQFFENDLKPKRRAQLLTGFAALAPNATLKRLLEKDEILFLGSNDS
ncbi:hypothetical protein [Burkholderia pyrrocinia]|uniref:hypothetical protein n=1 Tax=Burkholderia pyrrocinia TaxID=60550 RepID=UPI00126A39B7|nr:hypothetical protein [Burkholderia pyrrocinia]